MRTGYSKSGRPPLAPLAPEKDDDVCLMDKPFKGWLLKVKQSAGRASRMLSESNRRFFTLDFPGQLIYYSNTEGSPQISRPIRFQDVTKVEPLSQDTIKELDGSPEVSPIGRSDSKSSVGSRRSFSSLVSGRGGPGAVERYGFVLHYRQSNEARRMELLCSREEATQWFAALTVAVCLGNRRAELMGCKDSVQSEEQSTDADSGCRSRSSSPAPSSNH